MPRPRVTTVVPLEEALRLALSERGLTLASLRVVSRYEISVTYSTAPSVFWNESVVVDRASLRGGEIYLDAVEDALYDRTLDQIAASGHGTRPHRWEGIGSGYIECAACGYVCGGPDDGVPEFCPGKKTWKLVRGTMSKV